MMTPPILVIILILSVASEKQTKLRVLHGVEDVLNELPYVVSLLTARIKNEQIVYKSILRGCTGTLIAHTWVLTASHCLTKNLRLVRYGNMTAPHEETKSISKVLEQIRHPSYLVHRNGLQNDIGLILIEPIHITPGIVSSVDYKTLVGLRVRYAGFGYTFDVYQTVKEQIYMQDQFRALQIGEGVVVKCTHDLKQWGPAVCVAAPCSNRAADSAPGDSGGPLFYNGRIVAVTSGGDLGRRFGMPSLVEAILTPVSPYLNWMRAVMSGRGDAKRKKY